MKPEITTAINFLINKLMTQSGQALLRPPQVERLRVRLSTRLQTKFDGHWYPSSPLQGNGYRVLQNVDGRMDKVVLEAFREAGVPFDRVVRAFPSNFSIWVDPGSVEVQIGSDGSVWALDLVALSAVNAAHFGDGSAPTASTSARPSGKPAPRTPGTTPAKHRGRYSGPDGTLADISNVFAPPWAT
mmetsp:Transcript_23190/g.60654  ORF Transcript_23190/g.60654 Transcript_23190/m.60654 type:complete len:186 (+) Transcript_23190:327-884(+)